MIVNTSRSSVVKMEIDTLKTEINSIKPLKDGKQQESHYNGLNEPFGHYKSYSLRDFVAINAINHSCATGKHINSRLGYIKPTSSSKKKKKKN